MGLAVLPARLKKEMAELEEAILCGLIFGKTRCLLPSRGLGGGILTRHSEVNAENIHEIVQQEVDWCSCRFWRTQAFINARRTEEKDSNGLLTA